MEVSWKDSGKDISFLGVDMTTRVLRVAGQALLWLPPPPTQTVGKDINREESGFYHLACIKILFPTRLT